MAGFTPEQFSSLATPQLQSIYPGTLSYVAGGRLSGLGGAQSEVAPQRAEPIGEPAGPTPASTFDGLAAAPWRRLRGFVPSRQPAKVSKLDPADFNFISANVIQELRGPIRSPRSRPRS